MFKISISVNQISDFESVQKYIFLQKTGETVRKKFGARKLLAIC